MQLRSSNLAIVVVVSCAHAMVHLVEQSFASVEQLVSSDFGLSTQQSGAMGSALRIPFGFGAIVTGILADRMGAARVLSLYLAGTAIVCSSFLITNAASVLWWQMFMLGVFASMYHPAGLSLLTSATTPQNRSRALGIHGVFGSLGLASAPFLALTVLAIPGTTWRTFFLILSVVSGALVLVFRAGIAKYGQRDNADEHILRSPGQAVSEELPKREKVNNRPEFRSHTAETAPEKLHIGPFSILMVSSALSGIVYGGFLHFLTRYLSEITAFDAMFDSRESVARLQSAVVLFFGVGGQWLSGVLATPRRLPLMLVMVYLTNVPLLCWISLSSGLMSLVPCCLLAFVHFMNQPVYNSLLPDYIPVKTRSTWLGFSLMMTFGIGSCGPYLVGSFVNYRDGYLLLAAFSLVAGVLPIAIWWQRRDRFTEKLL